MSKSCGDCGLCCKLMGVTALDTGNGQRLSHRGGERFAMCSTFKLLLAAQTLRRVDQGHDKLDRRITYTKKDLVTYSPVTEPHADGAGLTRHGIQGHTSGATAFARFFFAQGSILLKNQIAYKSNFSVLDALYAACQYCRW